MSLSGSSRLDANVTPFPPIRASRSRVVDLVTWPSGSCQPLHPDVAYGRNPILRSDRYCTVAWREVWVPCVEKVGQRSSLRRSVGEDDMGPEIEDPHLPPLHMHVNQTCCQVVIQAVYMALSNTISDVLSEADEQRVTLLSSLDMTAAFDSVDHSLLLMRLQWKFGLEKTALEWMSSFLTGRIQQVA